jgi:hypothetical protein
MSASSAATSAAKKLAPSNQSTKPNYFAEIDTFGVIAAKNGDVITEWLSSPPLVTVTNPIVWWTMMGDAGDPLAPMALDFLSVPAASTDIERAFSHGGLTVSKRRHKLSEKSVRAATVLGSWAKIPSLIPEKEIIAGFNSKHWRPKGRDPETSATGNANEKNIIAIE